MEAEEGMKKKIDLVAEDIDVDAGMIIVADKAYMKEVPNRNDMGPTGCVFKVPVGKYKVRWAIRETWNDAIEGTESLEVTSGKIFVTDPCYVIGDSHDGWMKWLEATDYGKKLDTPLAFIIDEMGGDGTYKVKLVLERL